MCTTARSQKSQEKISKKWLIDWLNWTFGLDGTLLTTKEDELACHGSKKIDFVVTHEMSDEMTDEKCFRRAGDPHGYLHVHGR